MFCKVRTSIIILQNTCGYLFFNQETP